MERRKFFLVGLVGAIAAVTLGSTEAAARAIRPPSPEPLPQTASTEEAVGLVQEAQWGPPRRDYRDQRRRRPRCWTERRRVAFRDRWGRINYRWVNRRVCR
jgi:hypothetical protein